MTGGIFSAFDAARGSRVTPQSFGKWWRLQVAR